MDLGLRMLAVAGGYAVGWAACRWAACLVGEAVLPRRARAARLACALAWAGVATLVDAGPRVPELCLLCGVLVTLALTDLATRRIPDACILAAVGIRALFLLVRAVVGTAGVGALALRSVAAALAVGAVLAALTLVMDHLLGCESLGGGDLKLMMVAGLYLGFWGALVALFLACLLALAQVALGGAAARRDRTFAFGPALSLAMLLASLALPRAETWTNLGML